jgi:hypothetical protein
MHVFDNYNDLILHINAVTLDEMYQFIVDNIDGNAAGVAAVKELVGYYLIFAIENKNL